MCNRNPQDRDFKGIWVPRSIYFDPDLTWTEKILLVEIDSLDHGKGCYASNAYLSQFLQVSGDWLRHLLADMKRRGLITITESGGQRYIKLANESQRHDHHNDHDETSDDGEIELPPGAELQLTPGREADIETVYEFWNSCGCKKPWHVHTKLSYSIRVAVDSALRKYGVEQICEAITNYATILQSPDHYWTYSWTLSNFLMAERSGGVKKWFDFLPENFDEAAYRGPKREEKPKDQPVVALLDDHPGITETLVKMYRNMTNSQRFEPSPKQRNQFIEAAAMMVEYFKPFPQVDKNERFRMLRRVLERKYVEAGQTLNVGNFNSKYTWDTLVPQLMRELGHIE